MTRTKRFSSVRKRSPDTRTRGAEGQGAVSAPIAIDAPSAGAATQHTPRAERQFARRSAPRNDKRSKKTAPTLMRPRQCSKRARARAKRTRPGAPGRRADPANAFSCRALARPRTARRAVRRRRRARRPTLRTGNATRAPGPAAANTRTAGTTARKRTGTPGRCGERRNRVADERALGVHDLLPAARSPAAGKKTRRAAGSRPQVAPHRPLVGACSLARRNRLRQERHGKRPDRRPRPRTARRPAPLPHSRQDTRPQAPGRAAPPTASDGRAV